MTYRVMFVIAALETGGAEMMMLKLLTRLDRSLFQPHVLSLTDQTTMAKQFREIGVPVESLGMRRGVPDPRGMLRLLRRLRESRPHLVQTWMYHADLLGGIAAKLAGNIPVIWNIRNGTLAPDASKRLTVMTAKACARLSRIIPERIVCCAQTARDIHARLGYDLQKMLVIPNGFDVSRFHPDAEARQAVHHELNLPANALLVGLVARFHPQKDHETFIRAGALLKEQVPKAQFLLCGDGITWDNEPLRRAIEAAGLRDCSHLLGRRQDIPRLTAALDLATSSSHSGEAFSNAVGEAMACGIPCVVTNVGDSALIVGRTGKVVPARDPQALAAAWREILDLPANSRRRLGELGRRRVLRHFALDPVVRRYELLYQDVLSSRHQPAGAQEMA